MENGEREPQGQHEQPVRRSGAADVLDIGKSFVEATVGAATPPEIKELAKPLIPDEDEQHEQDPLVLLRKQKDIDRLKKKDEEMVTQRVPSILAELQTLKKGENDILHPSAEQNNTTPLHAETLEAQ
jgi:hypothetical protein